MKKLLISILFAIVIFSTCVMASTLTQITSGVDFWDPFTAPGNSLVVASCYSSSICTVPRGGGSITTISNAGWWPQITGNGTIVYIKNDGSYDQIYKNESGVETKLTNDAYDKWRIDLCPDDATIAYYAYINAQNTSIYTIPIAGGSPTRLTFGYIDGSGGYSYEPIDCGNTDIVFTRDDSGNYRIAKVPITGGSVTYLTTVAEGDSDTPSWSKDFAKITYQNQSSSSIMTMNADGSNKVRETTSGTYYNPFYCPDGTLYAVKDVGANYNVTRILPSELNIHQTENNWYFPICVSVSSHDIFFIEDNGTYWNLWQDHYDDPPGPSDPVPEFSTITLLLAALVALGGIFAFRRYR